MGIDSFPFFRKLVEFVASDAKVRCIATLKRVADILEKLSVAGIALGLFQGVSAGLWVGLFACASVLLLTYLSGKEFQKK